MAVHEFHNGRPIACAAIGTVIMQYQLNRERKVMRRRLVADEFNLLYFRSRILPTRRRFYSDVIPFDIDSVQAARRLDAKPHPEIAP